MRPLLLRRLSLIGFLLAAGGQAQDQASPAATAVDWPREVERACTSPRLGLRIAASRKVAEAGDEAVAAITAFAASKGTAAIPVTLVEAIADQGGSGVRTLGLLRAWADDRDFFWRAQALRGLARRAGPGQRADAERFAKHLADPAWLVRAFAAWGSSRTLAEGEPWRALLADPDPRARTRLAALLTQDGRNDGLCELVASLADERTFLGNPWGRRRAQEAFAALKAKFGTDHGYQPDADYAGNREAIGKFAALVGAQLPGDKKAGEEHGARVALPPRLQDAEVTFAGGVEVLSCRHGDLFLRWTADGIVSTGLAAESTITLPAEPWRALAAAGTHVQLAPQTGVVICDKLRLMLGGEAGHGVAGHGVAAPAALPAAATAWLEQLAATIEGAGDRALAAALCDRLQQFTAR